MLACSRNETVCAESVVPAMLQRRQHDTLRLRPFLKASENQLPERPSLHSAFISIKEKKKPTKT